LAEVRQQVLDPKSPSVLIQIYYHCMSGNKQHTSFNFYFSVISSCKHGNTAETENKTPPGQHTVDQFDDGTKIQLLNHTVV